MSRLKLYWPEHEVSALAPDTKKSSDTDDVILPFRKVRTDRATSSVAERSVAESSMLQVLVRAQTIRENRCCPQCNHPVVEPIELNDAISSRNGLPIPGSATLVGFRCGGCEQEWPI